MPELPEIETIKRGLKRTILGNTIVHVKVFRRDLRFPLDDRIEQCLLSKKILNVQRRAKFLILSLSKETTIIFHLGMSGKLTVGLHNTENHEIHKHDHFILHLNNKSVLIYNDPRRFGFIEVVNGNYKNYHRFNHVGIEPLSIKCNGDYLWDKLRKSSRTIKKLLMDQRIIAGLGNIYVNEALWKSFISPSRLGIEVTLTECTQLTESIKSVLRKAIKFGGTSLRDYRATGGEVGYFQNKLKVYGRKGKKCLRNKCEGKVIKTYFEGRSTFYCKICQK